MKTLLFCCLCFFTALRADPILPFHFSADVFERLIAIEPTVKGFVPIPFRESIEANAVNPTPEVFYQDPAVLLAEKQFEHFCETFQENSLPSPSIPPLIHIIWMGSPPPKTVEIAVASWRKYHPNWEVLLWTDKEIAELKWTTPHSALFYSQAKNWAEKSDILRFEILYQFGGIYADTDVLCLNNFEDLCKRLDFFAGFEENRIPKSSGRPLVGSAIIGAARGHPILKRCMEHSQTREEAPGILQHIRSGPGPLTRAAYEAIEAGCKNILLFPCSYFFPLPYWKRSDVFEEIKGKIRPESFAIHLWEASWFE